MEHMEKEVGENAGESVDKSITNLALTAAVAEQPRRAQ